MIPSKIRRGTVLAIAGLSLFALTACGSSTESGDANSEDMATESTQAADSEGLMSDASMAVPLLLETIWPIEGNDYADAVAVTAWCAKYATDKEGAVADVVVYLSDEPDITSADAATVDIAIDEYLDNNCYLLDE